MGLSRWLRRGLRLGLLRGPGGPTGPFLNGKTIECSVSPESSSSNSEEQSGSPAPREDTLKRSLWLSWMTRAEHFSFCQSNFKLSQQLQIILNDLLVTLTASKKINDQRNHSTNHSNLQVQYLVAYMKENKKTPNCATKLCNLLRFFRGKNSHG